jgi:hypothetical protein
VRLSAMSRWWGTVKQQSSLAVVDLPGSGGGGAAVPSPAWQVGGRHMARTLISSREWILAVPPPGSTGTESLRALAGILTGETRFQSATAQPMAIVRVRSAPGTQEIGAVLHYRNGTAVLYAPAGRLESLGAAALSAVASEAGIFSSRREGDTARTVTVQQVSHDSPVHPAAVAIGPRSCAFLVCSRLIDAGLAAMLGQVWTAHAELIALHG